MLIPPTAWCAFGCSICSPSMSHRYCCGVRLRTSFSLLGHWYTPCSNLLYSRRKPSPSQYKPLSRSRRLPQNRNSVLVNEVPHYLFSHVCPYAEWLDIYGHFITSFVFLVNSYNLVFILLYVRSLFNRVCYYAFSAVIGTTNTPSGR